MVKQAFDYLSVYIGDWGVLILSMLLFFVIIRILIASVFRLFRFNLDYRMHSTNRKRQREKAIEKQEAQALDDYYNGKITFGG